MSGRGRLQDGPLCEPLAPASPQGQNCGENGGRCLGVAVGCWSERTGAPRHRSGKQKCVGVQNTLYIYFIYTFLTRDIRRPGLTAGVHGPIISSIPVEPMFWYPFSSSPGTLRCRPQSSA